MKTNLLKINIKNFPKFKSIIKKNLEFVILIATALIVILIVQTFNFIKEERKKHLFVLVQLYLENYWSIWGLLNPNVWWNTVRKKTITINFWATTWNINSDFPVLTEGPNCKTPTYNKIEIKNTTYPKA